MRSSWYDISASAPQQPGSRGHDRSERVHEWPGRRTSRQPRPRGRQVAPYRLNPDPQTLLQVSRVSVRPDGVLRRRANPQDNREHGADDRRDNEQLDQHVTLHPSTARIAHG